MGILEEGAGGSVAPPGFKPTGLARPPIVPAAVDPPPTARPAAHPADAAVRWRIGAAVIDNVIVYGAYLILCALLHWRVTSLDHLWVLLAGGIAYHFALEVRDGQTVGKRRYGIRVVMTDDRPADARAVAARSLLRIIDQLPVLYVSGLVNMVRTGPARRQRLGDVAADTKVVAVDGDALAKGTPGWYLPAATILAVLVSAASAYAVLTAGDRPLSDTQRAQFVAGCERSPGSALIDCGCLLDQLQGAGYRTPNELSELILDARNPATGTATLTDRRVLIDAARACRR